VEFPSLLSFPLLTTLLLLLKETLTICLLLNQSVFLLLRRLPFAGCKVLTLSLYSPLVLNIRKLLIE
jgi:hypothetical protein